MAATLVHDPREEKQNSFLGRTRYYRTVACPAGAIDTLEPDLGVAMPAGYNGDTAAILIGSIPAKVAKTGQVRIRLVYEVLDEGTDPGLTIPATWMLLRREVRYRATRTSAGVYARCAFEVPEDVSDAEVDAAIPFNSVYPGKSGVLAPTRADFAFRDNHRPGTGILVVDWRPPLWGEEIPEGHGTLTFDVGGDTIKIVKDKKGDRVLGEFKEDGKPHRYIVIKGTAFQFVARCTMTLTVKARTPLVRQLMDLYGKVNASGLPNFGNAPRESMRFDGVRSTRVLIPNSLYLMRYRLAYEPEGWNKILKVQRQELELLRQSEVDEAGAATGTTRTVPCWKDDGDPETRENHKTANFSILQAILSW